MKYLILLKNITFIYLLYSLKAFSDASDSVHIGNHTSREEVINILAPIHSDKAIHTRGFSLHSAIQEAEKTQARIDNVGPRALSIDIYFEYDSSELVESAKEQLDPIGDAMQSDELSAVEFILEGHTDASGGVEYNKGLSKRRAEAVKEYLQYKHQLDPRRLTATGKGASDLYDHENPLSGVNRRVTIIAD